MIEFHCLARNICVPGIIIIIIMATIIMVAIVMIGTIINLNSASSGEYCLDFTSELQVQDYCISLAFLFLMN